MKLAKILWGLAISGGSVKIPKLYAFLEKAWEKLEYSVLVGTSSGAILVLLAVTGNIKAGKEMILNFTTKDIFTENPFSFWGRVMTVWRVFFKNKINLYDESKLADTIRKVITPVSFYEYKGNPDSPDAFVNVVDPETGKEHFINLKALDYEQAIDAVLGSASIPFFAAPVWLRFLNIFSYDGGWRSHIGSGWLAKNYGDRINGLVSLLSRPESIEDYPRWKVPDYNFNLKDYIFFGASIINILVVAAFLVNIIAAISLGWLISTPLCIVLFITSTLNALFFVNRGINIAKLPARIMEVSNYEISVNDIEKADHNCLKNGIEHITIYSAEHIGGDGLYKTDKEAQERLYETGLDQAEETFKAYNL